MKIREVRIQNFRSFGPELRTISFVDPLTDQVRPLSVLVGSNGSGKTTVLEVIELLLEFAVSGDDNVHDAAALRSQGFADLTITFSETAPPEVPRSMRIALGRNDRTSVDYRQAYGSSDICRISAEGSRKYMLGRDAPREALDGWASAMRRGHASVSDGLLFFPHRRWFEHEQRGSIGEPANSYEWLFHYRPSERWKGSLSQLWVWKNYLDLEQNRDGHPNLMPFVAAIETILGPGRRISIRHGRVSVTHPVLGSVELHQLPSGEQQILTLFGEIIRRLRPGAVVMIDEVEISLHPALQRAVLFHLRELARAHDLQIVLTTHSMDIVSAVAPEEVINLDEMVLAERARAQGAAT